MANETILVVDGDTRSRKILEVSFKKSGYRVLMTDTISGAVEYLEDENPDLIVSDTDLPDGDGFEFCKRIKENPDWEYTPFLFLTDESSLPRKIEGIEIGADDYLTRPIYIKEVTTRVEVLLQKRDREMLSEGEVEEFQGELSEITLIDLLQTIDEESRSGVIEFSRGERSGTITFRNGAVIDANCGKLRGPQAVYRLMLWPGGRFLVRYHDDVPGRDHIGMPIEELLLEGVHRIERWDEIVSELPPFERVYEPDYERLPGFLDAVPEEVGRVVRLFDGYRNLRDVVDDSPVGDVMAAEIIEQIFEEGILEEVSDEREQSSASDVRESHLSNWLESSGEVDRDEFQEENTSPGYPSSAKGDDPHETQEIERDDLTTALSDELDEDGEQTVEAERPEEPASERAVDESEQAPDAFDEEELDPNESGPRYMPDERDDTKRGYAEVDREPASVDETLDELEEAERKRRKEEAKRLVEQKHESGEHRAAPADDTRRREAERPPSGREDAPKIPGATRTRSGSEESPAESVAVSDTGEAATQEEQRDAADKSVGGEAADRGRTDTPRAHPTAEDEPEQQQSTSHRSRKQTRAGLGETGLEQGGESEVPVSFETVESGEQDAGSEAESESSESPSQSMTEEAAEAVRQSAREALEDAEFETEDWSEHTERREVSEESTDREGGREREDTTPYGDEETPDTALEDREQRSPSESEAPGRSDEAPPAGARQEGVESAPREEEIDEAPPDDIERVSNNGEVVRTEYDLSGPEAGGEPASDTLEGVSSKPEAADETIESEETLEGVSQERRPEDDDPERTDGSAPSDDTLDGFSGSSGEAEVADQEVGEARQSGDEQSAFGGSQGADAQSTGDGLNWEEEPTARDFEFEDEGEEVADPEFGESLEETTDEPSADPSGPSVRIESEAFAAPDEDTAPFADEEEGGEATGDDAEIAGEEMSSEVQTPESRGPDETSRETTDESVDADGETTAPADRTPDVEQEGSEELDHLTDSEDEVSFFEEDEQEESYDWDLDEDVEDQGRGGIWAIVIVLFVVGVVAGVAVILGPFSEGGEGESGDESTSEAVATSDEPESTGSGEESEEESTEEEEKKTGAEAAASVPSVESNEEAESVSKETAAAVGETAKRRSRILGGDDPYLAAPAPDAGDAGTDRDAGPGETRQQVASNEQQGAGGPSGQTGSSQSGSGTSQQTTTSSATSSGGGSGGGGTAAQVRRVKRLIQSGQLSSARSKLRDLKQQAPGRSDVADLYLDLASKLQIDGNVEQAKSAYRSYLDMQPEGPRAEEVRSILDRL